MRVASSRIFNRNTTPFPNDEKLFWNLALYISWKVYVILMSGWVEGAGLTPVSVKATFPAHI